MTFGSHENDAARRSTGGSAGQRLWVAVPIDPDRERLDPGAGRQGAENLRLALLDGERERGGAAEGPFDALQPSGLHARVETRGRRSERARVASHPDVLDVLLPENHRGFRNRVDVGAHVEIVRQDVGGLQGQGPLAQLRRERGTSVARQRIGPPAEESLRRGAQS